MLAGKKSKHTRFEVDYKQRLKQRDEAQNAVRLPRLGYKQYRVYEEKEKEKTKSNNTYKMFHTSVGISTGPISIYASGQKYPKSNISILKSRNSVQKAISSYMIILDELFEKINERHQVRWLKPKHVTLLRLQGIRVEEV